MKSRAAHALIGLATLVVLAVLFGLGYWFSRGQGDTIDVKVVFNGKVSGLGRGSSVLFNGLRIGEVKELEIEPSDPRQIYAILKISQSAPLRVDTIARLEGQGLAGIVAVQLRGGSPAAAPLIAGPGQALPTIIAESSESIFEKVGSIAKGIDEALVGIDAAIQANAGPVTEKIKYVENLSATLNSNSSEVDKFMQSVSSAAEFITPLPDRLKDFSEGFMEALRSVDKDRVASVIDDADQLAAKLSAAAPDIGKTVRSVASMSEKLNRAADQVDGVLKGAQAFLTGAGRENGGSVFEDVAEAAKSLRTLADNLDRSSAAVAAKIIQFTGSGLQKVETLTSDGSRALSGFDRTLRNVNRDPQGLIFGSKNRIPQYNGSR
ncbi:phospholipid/cholesterol/gamma-HCH transport system substrate-binding protein [Bosea sp. AK1]|uniref:MlaD family protein n=1 Tax=Bosea sp. AK1 TaxID=2587160 RepID=UPI001153D64A|nr:MlaD family protein [Bosea sp. AK1]TQI76944.1 phospholipid/cholesterol/gamma-HCH transport system substrate-binding protein [Bosea sp. AK1]